MSGSATEFQHAWIPNEDFQQALSLQGAQKVSEYTSQPYVFGANPRDGHARPVTGFVTIVTGYRLSNDSPDDALDFGPQ